MLVMVMVDDLLNRQNSRTLRESGLFSRVGWGRVGSR